MTCLGQAFSGFIIVTPRRVKAKTDIFKYEDVLCNIQDKICKKVLCVKAGEFFTYLVEFVIKNFI